jgi:hypothetical protein
MLKITRQGSTLRFSGRLDETAKGPLMDLQGRLPAGELVFDVELLAIK